jgi:hypothetical protein
METTRTAAPDAAAERLASEVADVQASISLVNSGVATRITLTGLRFGRQIAERLRLAAAADGIDLETSFWPEEDVGDLHISRMQPDASAESRRGGESGENREAAGNG